MSAPAQQKCPACGAQTSGKFCGECGAPLGSMHCPSCGAKLSARAKFCPECGTPTGRAGAPADRRSGGPTGSRPDRLPWYVAGVAVVALLVTVVVVVARRNPGGPVQAGAEPFSPDQAATTDLSTMPPREQADRLFDRVARATEAGDTSQVRFFGPMALQAYQMLGGSLDPDARLHVGLIELGMGNAAGANAQADTIQRASRTHLFGYLLKARAAEATGNAAAARDALRGFLGNYQSERAKNLTEYQQHAQILTETRDEAERKTGGAARS